MRFELRTLVDITRTDARRGQDAKLISQQANYNTVIQTVMLRTNIVPGEVTKTVQNVDNQFGSNAKGKQSVWSFEFDCEYAGALTTEMLEQDFDLGPVITDLDETYVVHNKAFSTKHPSDTNIVFKTL